VQIILYLPVYLPAPLNNDYDEPLPPILQSYMAAGTGIWLGDTVVDEDFGNALEIGIVIPVSEIDRDFRSRFA